MTETLRQTLLAYALDCAADVSHGEGHIRRVLKNALALAKGYPEADRDALAAAAILHDCAQAEQIADSSVHHAEAGAKKAERFLRGLGLSESFIERVCAAIAAHSSPERAGKAGIEARLLFDADKLDMCGAVGLSRALMYALDRGEALYSAEGESFWQVAQNDADFVEENLFTPEARALAARRLALSRAFLENLEDEAK